MGKKKRRIQRKAFIVRRCGDVSRRNCNKYIREVEIYIHIYVYRERIEGKRETE